MHIIPGMQYGTVNIFCQLLTKRLSIQRSCVSQLRNASPALIVLDVAVVSMVGSVRYPPAVVGHHDERVGKVACVEVAKAA